MKKRECIDYFESYIKYLVDTTGNHKKSALMKKHISTCSDCQDRFLIFIDIIDEYLLENNHQSTLSLPVDINTMINNLYGTFVDKTIGNIIKYLLIYKKYRNTVIDILPFNSTEDLFDFYENKLIPAFDEQNTLCYNNYNLEG